jgi:DNA mismatch repair protein MutS
VAALAGVPAAVTARARAVLAQLESAAATPPAKVAAAAPAQPELPLFSTPLSPVLGMLDRLEPDAMSPREALDFLYLLKKTHREG